MDSYHGAFLEQLDAIKASSADTYMVKFSEMIEHTKEHFAFEEALMKEYSFYGKHEHESEHAKLLNEMQYFYEKAKKMPPFGKSYINDYAFDKFKQHVLNIDSQLAMFLKEQGL